MSCDSPLRQRGLALAVGLVLLVIITLLALAGINAATTELALGGNEKSRQLAFEAAEAGLEIALALAPRPTGDTPTARIFADPEFPDSRAQIETRFAGASLIVPGYSVDRFIARHYEIRSRGSGPREARAEHVAGIVRIAEQP